MVVVIFINFIKLHLPAIFSFTKRTKTATQIAIYENLILLKFHFMFLIKVFIAKKQRNRFQSQECHLLPPFARKWKLDLFVNVSKNNSQKLSQRKF